jgi:hypothetical protein
VSTTKESESPYWLFGWLEARRVKTRTELNYLLGSKAILHELRDVAEQWADSGPSVPTSGFNLVAGTGLRLDDLLTCPSFACRRQQVDVLFRHAWHYFDRILLPDGVGHQLRYGRFDANGFFLENLSNWIALAMYIRDLEATNLVCFYPKHGLPPKGFLKMELGEENYRSFRGAREEVHQRIIEEGEFTFTQKSPSMVHVSFNDPLLAVGTELDLTVQAEQGTNKSNLRKATAREILKEHLDFFTEDLHAKSHLAGTLGSVVWTHELLLTRIGQPKARDVVLRMSLPSINRVPVKELIAIRESEGDSFASFRNALTSAAQKMTASTQNASAHDLSEQIVQDLVQPELVKIEARLRSARKTLKRKTALSLAVGALATKCGLLLGLGPTAGPIGIGAAAAGSMAAGAKYLEEKQSIELSDMYFLWKALQHAKTPS